MADIGLHFSAPWWLLGLLMILPVAAWLRRSNVYGNAAQVRRYADAQLLPYLTGSRELRPRERRNRLLRWALMWSALVIAMAGPRWDYSNIQLFTPAADLVILLDISASMEVADVRPSRLARARQEIEDLINRDSGIRIGLVIFASVAHVVTPVTADYQAIRQLLPALTSDLARLRGSRLGPALERAKLLLAGEPKRGLHNILLISDGDFADADAIEQVRALAKQGVRLHVLGVGTAGGGPVPGVNGRLLSKGQQVVESRLDQAGLKQLAEAGQGLYVEADYRDHDSAALIEQVLAGGGLGTRSEEQVRIWNERFYWLLLPVLLALLPGFRRYRTAQVQR